MWDWSSRPRLIAVSKCIDWLLSASKFINKLYVTIYRITDAVC